MYVVGDEGKGVVGEAELKGLHTLSLPAWGATADFDTLSDVLMELWYVSSTCLPFRDLGLLNAMCFEARAGSALREGGWGAAFCSGCFFLAIS